MVAAATPRGAGSDDRDVDIVDRRKMAVRDLFQAKIQPPFNRYISQDGRYIDGRDIVYPVTMGTQR